MNNFIYKNPTKLIFGKNQINNLASELSVFGKKALLVYGGGSIKKSGLYDTILQQLANFEIYELANVEPNPRVTTAQKGADLVKEHNIDVILAVGGGSVIDCTKLIAAASCYDGDAWDIVKMQVPVTQAKPFGVILTLAATGSEMNAGSVITNTETLEKRGWGSPLVYPTFSILDPSYTFTVPRNQTVNGIVDMMSHLIEQYFNEAENTVVMDRMIEGVLKAIMETSPVALDNPYDYEARKTLMVAGTVALNGSLRWGYNGDWSSHGIEHAISAVYDIAHAEGLAIVMPNWMSYVMPYHVEKFATFARNVFNIQNTEDRQCAELGIQALRDFWTSIGAVSRLSDKNIDDSRFEEMVNHCVQLGGFHPLSATDIMQILKMSL